MPEVTLTGHIVVPSSDLDAVMTELPIHIRSTRNEPGCIEFEVTHDEINPQMYHVRERFDSTSAFLQHQNRVRTSKWGSITANAERHYTISGLDST